ncbi:MAG: branched-chain amino acid ABC transporter permease [Leucobacter sp.]
MNPLLAISVGLTAGGTFALFGVLLTVMSRLGKVVNFSQVAVGVFGAFLAIRIVPRDMQPWGSVVVGMIVAMLLSVAIGFIIAKWLGDASVAARSATTVAILLGLFSLSNLLFGTRPQPVLAPFKGPIIQTDIINISQLAVVTTLTAVVVAVVTKLVLRYTMVGTRLRAVSDRQDAAELMGINVMGLQLGVWAVTGLVAGFGVAVVANIQATDANSMITIFIPSAAAALVGAFRRLDLAIIGGLAIGALQGLLTAFPSIVLLKDWIPILVIVVFLLWTERKEVWDVAR